MKKRMWVVGILVILLVLLNGVLLTQAQSEKGYDELAPHVLGYWIPSGQYCVTEYRTGEPFTECYCECELSGDCPVPTPVPTPTDTPEPPDPTPVPEKEKCNSGRGNDSEGDPDCDPGNSGDHNEGGD